GRLRPKSNRPQTPRRRRERSRRRCQAANFVRYEIPPGSAGARATWRSSTISTVRCMSGSLLRMRFLKPCGVTLFESLFKSLQVGCSRRILELFSRTLLLEILLGHYVHLSFRRQRCTGRRFFSGLLTAFISSPFFRRCAVSRVMSVQHRHATREDPCHSDQHRETHRLELSGHYTR